MSKIAEVSTSKKNSFMQMKRSYNGCGGSGWILLKKIKIKLPLQKQVRISDKCGR
jgi:hypothetical protein